NAPLTQIRRAEPLSWVPRLWWRFAMDAGSRRTVAPSYAQMPPSGCRQTEGMIEPEEGMQDRPLSLFRRLTRTGAPVVWPQQCSHLREAAPQANPRTPDRCEDHQPEDGWWVHLRACVACGHVGCCDSSTPRHATAHHLATGHPVIQSIEPGERWRWCYLDEV